MNFDATGEFDLTYKLGTQFVEETYQWSLGVQTAPGTIETIGTLFGSHNIVIPDAVRSAEGLEPKTYLCKILKSLDVDEI